MEVGETDPFRMQPIEVRGFEDRVAVGGDVAVALVVGENEDDVRFLPRDRVGGHGRAEVQPDDERERGERANHEYTSWAPRLVECELRGGRKG